MGRFQDLSGQQFGKLFVLERDYEYPILHNKKDHKSYKIYYRCRCSCGEELIVAANHLKDGHTTSCGCQQRQIVKKSAKYDLVGMVFSKLTVTYPTEKRENRQVVWHCVCECGNEIEVPRQRLTQGITKSCGCLNSIGEMYIQQLLTKSNIKFEKEKIFKDLVSPNGGYYRYDFYLPGYNRLIEFDGEQHFSYRINNSWNNKEKFLKTQEQDKIKNEYALSHNIPLVRIPYWERDNITLEMILGDKYLFKTKDLPVAASKK